MNRYIVNSLERNLGIDLNGDGYIGGQGFWSSLERATGIDFNGDGIIGRPFDVMPRYPMAYPSMGYALGHRHRTVSGSASPIPSAPPRTRSPWLTKDYEVPKGLQFPIISTLFHDSVVASDGHTYEREAIIRFNPDDVSSNKYGHSLHFWDWSKRKYLKTIDLGKDGLIPLELRFCHNPTTSYGYVVCALGSSVFRYFQDDLKEWQVEKVIQVESATGNNNQPVPAIISDMLISLNDKFIYFCNWLHGDVRQYDITNPSKPKLTGQIWLGGLIKKDNDFQDKRSLTGGPQMIQLSLDGKRLYVTNSLYSSWDDQFYPGIKQDGSYLIKIDCDSENGGMKLDQNFYISFKNEPHGPSRAHEVRYPGGDSTSDIWN
ncbi:unnamed protein product [Rotaria sp. Silwood1]|nr:unnamed protein product [Rotaria sp. Silwood1]